MDSNGRMSGLDFQMTDLVMAAGFAIREDVVRKIPLSRLDRSQFPWWIASLSQAEINARLLRTELEAVLNDDDQ